MTRLLVSLTCVAALLLAPVSAHAAAGGNVGATSAYLRANHRLVQVVASKIPTIEGRLRKVLAGVRRECPKAAAASPQNPQSTQLSNEVIGALVMSIVELDRPAGRAFVRVVAPLRWSNGGLTRTIRSYVGKVRTLLALPQPNLCADVRGWATSGFTALTQTTVSFSPAFMAAWVSAGEQPPALARYESAADRALAARTRKLEQRIADLEAREVETWGAIMNTLELWP
ncbi:MAG TPA: hypothetical protein VFW29_09920 [Solirubrobacteraceae bacterium]|nr:hypothetical protein [Solirubrobacteraceae bacterium]